MVVVNLHLKGKLEKLVNRYVSSGYAASKAEVLRMGLRKLADSNDFEDVSDDPELQKLLLGIKTGKIKPRFKGPVSSVDQMV
ncbi:Uncharacterised protein [Candidatus Gugararchaeum adminiculabundum]|nr:Uncharacterised protein [Candidatus Gugararchaeum adminiculabundum]